MPPHLRNRLYVVFGVVVWFRWTCYNDLTDSTTGAKQMSYIKHDRDISKAKEFGLMIMVTCEGGQAEKICLPLQDKPFSKDQIMDILAEHNWLPEDDLVEEVNEKGYLVLDDGDVVAFIIEQIFG